MDVTVVRRDWEGLGIVTTFTAPGTKGHGGDKQTSTGGVLFVGHGETKTGHAI